MEENIILRAQIVLERFGSFLIQKIDFESQNFAIFDTFTQQPQDLKTFYGPKGRPGRVCDSVR